MLLEAVAIPAVNQVTLPVVVLLLALHHQCVVAALVVDTEEAFEVGLLAPIVRQPATNVVDQTIMLATAKLRP